MKHKFWRGHAITKVMRSLHQKGWSSQDITTFFVKAGIPISTTTINNEKHKLRQGAATADLDADDETAIQEVMAGTYTTKPSMDDVFEEDEDKPAPKFDDSKLLALMNQMTISLGEISKRLDKQDDKIAQIEEIAVATCKKIEVTLPKGETKVLDEMPHPMLDYALAMVQGAILNGKRQRINVALIGPAGSGKTYLAGQISRILSLEFGFLSCSSGMSESQYLGRSVIGKSGAFEYQRPDFVRIVEEGGVWLWDEMDAADANATLTLNAILDGDKLAVPNRVDKPYAVKHKNHITMAAMNTHGNGADRQFVGRNQLDGAFLDRFMQIELDYSPELEAYLCPDHELRERIQKYRKNCRTAQVRRVISSRFLKRAFLLKTIGKIHPSDATLDDTIDRALFIGWKPEEVAKAKGAGAY